MNGRTPDCARRAFRPAIDAGHLAPVTAMTVSLDGLLLATGDDDGIVIVWDLSCGRMLLHLNCGRDSLTGLAFSPDGARLVASCCPPILVLWSLPDGRWLGNIPGYLAPLGYRRDGTLAAVRYTDGPALAVVEVESGSLERLIPIDRLAGSPYLPFNIAISRNGGNSASLHQTLPEDPISLQVWDTGQETLTCTVDDAASRDIIHYSAALSISADGSKAAMRRTHDRDLAVWDTLSGVLLRTLNNGYSEGIEGLELSPGGDLLGVMTVYGQDAYFDLFSLPEFEPCDFFELPRGQQVVAFTTDSTRLVISGRERWLELWELADHRIRHRMRATRYPAVAVAWSPDCTQVAVAHADDRIEIWDVRDASRCGALHHPVGASPTLSISSCGTILTLYNTSGRTSWNLLSCTLLGRKRRKWDWGSDEDPLLAVSSDGMREVKRVPSRSGDTDRLWLTDYCAGRRGVLHGSDMDCKSIAISPDGAWIAAGDWDFGIRIWSASERRLVDCISQSGPIEALAISLDNRLIAAGQENVYLRWLDTTGDHLGADRSMNDWIGILGSSSGEETTATAHPAGVTGIAFSPDGSRMATCGKEGALKIWDTSTRHLLATMLVLPNDDNTASDEWISWSPEGILAASPGADRWHL